tara:strand:- start:905 stop:1096 length:192 start_codon:yes stop_codon:yes gene_type:complete
MSEEPPLTQEELTKMRMILKMDERRAWLMSNMRSGASWIVIVLAATVAMWDAIQRTIKAMMGS